MKKFADIYYTLFMTKKLIQYFSIEKQLNFNPWACTWFTGIVFVKCVCTCACAYLPMFVHMNKIIKINGKSNKK